MKVEFSTEEYRIIPRNKNYYFGLITKKVYDLFLGTDLIKTYDTLFEADYYKNAFEMYQFTSKL